MVKDLRKPVKLGKKATGPYVFFRSLFLWTSANDNITRILYWHILDTHLQLTSQPENKFDSFFFPLFFVSLISSDIIHVAESNK